MGCCSSSASQVTPQNQPLAKPEAPLTSNGHAHVDQNNNTSAEVITEKTNGAPTKTISDNASYGEFRARQFDINDLDRQSLDSVRTGKSLVFPNHKDVEVLTCTPPRKETFIKMEDTFWPKKRQLIPDYSVMEKIDKHVLAVGSCSF